jgi:hypothetical protein
VQGLSSTRDGIDIPIPAKANIKRFKWRFSMNKVTQKDFVNLGIPFIVEFIKSEIISWM